MLSLSNRYCPDVGASRVIFIATMPTASLHFQRLHWSRQIELSNDGIQSRVVVHPVTMNVSRWPGRAEQCFRVVAGNLSSAGAP